MADHLIERVRDCEKAAIERKRQVQSLAKELVETARRDGEKRLAVAEREAWEILSASEMADADAQDKLWVQAEDEARIEAETLKITACSRMDKAVAWILESVGGVWQ